MRATTSDLLQPQTPSRQDVEDDIGDRQDHQDDAADLVEGDVTQVACAAAGIETALATLTDGMRKEPRTDVATPVSEIGTLKVGLAAVGTDAGAVNFVFLGRISRRLKWVIGRIVSPLAAHTRCLTLDWRGWVTASENGPRDGAVS